jgi:pantothenate kinase
MAAEARVIDIEALVALAVTFSSRRHIIAIAGAPGSGKSTASEILTAQLNAVCPGSAAILPMDGYHYDDVILNERGLRSRKGAPDTFDVGGLKQMLTRLKQNDEDEIAAPVFDRSLELSRGSARMIANTVRVIVVEGNYLLLNRRPWSELRSAFDTTVMIKTSEEVLRERLTKRWKDYALSPDEVNAKVELNDLLNGRFVLNNSITPDFLLIG